MNGVPFTICANILVFLLLPSIAAGQDQSWFQKHLWKDPARYEGLFDQPNARRAYDILSFRAVSSPGDLDSVKAPDSTLHVGYFVPEGLPPNSSDEGPVSIRVRQIHGRVHYLMKSYDPAHDPKKWNVFSWPEKDVLLTSPVDIKNLGVVVRLGGDNEYNENLAPALFFSNAPKQPLTIRRYELVLKIQEGALTSLSYRWSVEGNHEAPDPTAKISGLCFYSPAAACSAHPVKGTIEDSSVITLSLDLADVPPGQVHLSIEGQYQNEDGKLLANYHFFHQPHYTGHD